MWVVTSVININVDGDCRDHPLSGYTQHAHIVLCCQYQPPSGHVGWSPAGNSMHTRAPSQTKPGGMPTQATQCFVTCLNPSLQLHWQKGRVLWHFRDHTVSPGCLSRWWILLAGVVHQWVSLRERQLQFCPAVVHLFIYCWALPLQHDHWGDDHHLLKTLVKYHTVEGKTSQIWPAFKAHSTFSPGLVSLLTPSNSTGSVLCCKTAAKRF